MNLIEIFIKKDLAKKFQTVYLEKLIMENEFNKKEKFYCVVFELYEKELDKLKQQLEKNKDLNIQYYPFDPKITKTNKNGKYYFKLIKSYGKKGYNVLNIPEDCIEEHPFLEYDNNINYVLTGNIKR